MGRIAGVLTVGLVALAMALPAPALTTIAQGSMVLPFNGAWPSPEMIQFSQGSCNTSITSGNFIAAINVKAYRGRTVKLTATTAQLAAPGAPAQGVGAYLITTCAPTAAGALIAFAGPSKQFSIPSTAVGLVLTNNSAAVVGQGYKLELV